MGKRYRYLRTPMGHCAAPDTYTRRYGEAIVLITRKFKCIDDTLLYAAMVEESFWHACKLLETCVRKDITIKPEKFTFCKRETDFVEFHIG